MDTISRKHAKQQNLRYYFTGNPCKHGHISLRKVSNFTCCECEKQHRSQYYTNHVEDIQKYNTEYSKTYHSDGQNRVILTKNARRWRQKNPDVAKASGREYYARYPEKQHARNAVRRAKQKQAIPVWFESQAVYQMYYKARQLTNKTGVSHHVDHIVPLQSDVVCGLHCLANLQILTAPENIKKSNIHCP